MKPARIFQAYIRHAVAFVRLGDAARAASSAAEMEALFAHQRAMKAEGQRLWAACLAAGYTEEDGVREMEAVTRTQEIEREIAAIEAQGYSKEGKRRLLELLDELRAILARDLAAVRN